MLDCRTILLPFLVSLCLSAAPSTVKAQFTHLPPGCNLDLGDIVIGPPDPGVAGPFDVVIAEYGNKDEIISLPDFPHPVEFLAEVAYPQQTACGPFPIVFMMHGVHETCVNPADYSVVQIWPCEEDQVILPNYQGYRYLAKILASHGIVAVSISANGINGSSNMDVGSLDARARLFQRHIGKWLEFSTTSSPEFGQAFVGNIDLKRIGVLGHSRGGGGAARLVDVIDQANQLGAGLIAPGNSTNIRAVLLVGAVEGDTQDDYEITDAALGVILPYCDGDQEFLPSVAYYDASRYALPGDSGPKHSFEILGANHNYFNTFWDPNETMISADDDWVDEGGYVDLEYCVPGAPGSGRLTSEEQRGALVAIGSAFFRTYLRNEKAFRPFLTGEAPPPPSAMTDQIFVAYHPKDEPTERLDLSRLTDKFETITNTLGGDVEFGGFARFEYCDASGQNGILACLSMAPKTEFDSLSASTGIAPHAFDGSPADQLRIGWDQNFSGPFYINEIPADLSDVSGYRALQFRAFVDYSDPLNPIGKDQDFRIVLVDGAGLSASATVSDYSRALFFPPAVEELDTLLTPIPRAILNTVRVPLSAFDGIFLTDVREAVLVFDKTQTGAINIADMMFADEASNTPPRLSCSVANPLLMPAGDKLEDVGLAVTVEDDQDTALTPLVTVYSDEDDLDTENKQSSPDAKNIITSGNLLLRAERDKNSDGRVYIILSTATDGEGALGHTCCTAIVPNGNQMTDISDVEAQATAASGQCTRFAAASLDLASLPPGFFEVGDGPIVGPKQ